MLPVDFRSLGRQADHRLPAVCGEWGEEGAAWSGGAAPQAWTACLTPPPGLLGAGTFPRSVG